MNIVEWSSSKWGFWTDRHYSATAGKWILKRGPIRLADYHARILAHCFSPGDNGRFPYDTVCIAEPAKSGKSALSALVHAYFALHVEPPAEQYVVSNKKDQAQSKVFKSLCQAFEWNPHLRIEPNRYELTTKAGTVVKAIPANSRTESGARFTLVSFDEPWAIIYEDGTRLVGEFKHDPTRNVSIQLFTGYGGYAGESDLWLEQLQRGLAGEPVPELADLDDGRGQPACWRNGRHFTFWSHVCRQPWQTEQWIESQRASLRPAEFARMIETDFAEGVGNFVSQDAWEACIDPNHRPLEPGSGVPIFAGLDLATAAGGDDCALVCVFSEGGKVKVALHKVWKGQRRREKLKLKQTVFPYLLDVKASYNLAGVWFDPWQALSLAEDLRGAGIRCVEVPQTHATRGQKDTTLHEMVVNRELVLYDHPDLRRAALGATAKELGSGLLFLKKASGRSRIDLLVALANVADVARYKRTSIKIANLGQHLRQRLDEPDRSQEKRVLVRSPFR